MRFTYHGFGFATLELAQAARIAAEDAGYVSTHSPAGRRHVIWDSATGEAL